MTDSQTPRRAMVIDLLDGFRRPLHFQEIADRLAIAPRLIPALSRVLDDLVFDGTVNAMPGQRFALSDKQTAKSRDRTVTGFLNAHARGFAFVSTEGDAPDIFIPAEAVGGALHGDKVNVRIVATSHRGPEGAVVEIVERRAARISGTLRRRGKSTWIEPDDSRIRGPVVIVPAANVAALPTLPRDGNDGDVAIVRITRFPVSADENPEGVLEEVLGPAGTPDVEVRKILAIHSIVEPHDHAAVVEAESYGQEVSAEALVGRVDLTHLPLPTIDPEDARDHDDAVWAVREEDGSYRVWVAIADVSAYVTPGSALDTAALARGNSIYLPDRAIPMLPRALSSNLCSLLPNVIRLCLCAEITLDAAGNVTGKKVMEGFMRSFAKLTYEGVARALGLTTEVPRSEAADALRDDLKVLRDIAGLLRAKRMQRGALDFNLPEAKIVVDQETKAPLDAVRRARDPGVAKAYQIVEELMLLANETIATFLVERGVPTIFRNHAAPDPTKIARFAAMCARLDVPFDPEEAADPKKLSAFLKKTQGHPDRSILDTLLVRSMKQAAYDVANIGHFGLASQAYLHFTSPIRRYPDLVVHRAVRAVLREQPIDRSVAAVETLRLAAVTASERERRGMEVERAVVDLYRALFMKDKVGETYTGTATGFVGSGVFVTIDEPFVEVLVRADALGPDSYQLDEEGLAMVAARSGDRVDIGDPMMLVIEDVAILRRTIYGRRTGGGKRDEDGDRPKRSTKRSGSTRATGAPSGSGRSGPAPTNERSGGPPNRRGAPPGRGGPPGKKGAPSSSHAKPGKPARSKKAGKKRR